MNSYSITADTGTSSWTSSAKRIHGVNGTDPDGPVLAKFSLKEDDGKAKIKIQVKGEWSGYGYSGLNLFLLFYNGSTKLYELDCHDLEGHKGDDGTYLSLGWKELGNATGTKTYNIKVKCYYRSVDSSGNAYVGTKNTSCNDYDSEEDCSAKITLKRTWYTAPSNFSVSVSTTGTTLTATPNWTSGTNTCTCTLVCNGVSVTLSKNSSHTFTGLINNTSYAVAGTLTDGTTTLTTTPVDTTYGVSIYSQTSTTNNISFTASNTKAKSFSGLSYYIHNVDASELSVPSTNGVVSRAAYHNTTYTITVYVTNVTDAQTTFTITTKLLSLVNTGWTAFQFGVNTTWQAKSGTDIIAAGGINFSNRVVQLNGTAISVTNSGSYPNWNVSGLKSGTTYKLIAYVSDGVNTVSAEVTITTLSPHVWININGTANGWRKATPYIYTSSGWKKANVYLDPDKGGFHEMST